MSKPPKLQLAGAVPNGPIRLKGVAPHCPQRRSCHAVCFKEEWNKEDPLSKEGQRRCQGTKYDHEGQKTSTRYLQKENPIVCYSIDKAEEDKKGKLFLLSLWT
ncbi:hypothetical protein X798_07116 [Onchocerca flexuosa]|uniref:Uncharacterized protein n=1 Tax=Onchocerca flexuosa TaxID=387005 RepID=A0A238BMS2_9BILA|nr:hypothetical protein X798_07116 [Onchocerca flexuosa]